MEVKLTGSCDLAAQPELSLLPREVELAQRHKFADALPSGEYLRSDDTVVARSELKAEAEQAKRRLVEIHEQNPMAGAQELAKLTAKGAALRSAPEDELHRLFSALQLEFADGKVGVPGAGGIPPKWRETYERIKERFRGDPSHFPTLTVLKRDFPAASRLVSELLASGELHHLGAGAVVTGEIYDRWVGLIKKHLQRNGQISVQEAKQLTRASRKYIIPLLEQLDKRGVTRRVEDVRKPGARFGE
jgi:selenocysteine-specific elongation factor